MQSMRLDASKKTVGLFLQRKWPNVSQGLVLNDSVAFYAVNHHGASVMNLGKGTKSLVMSWRDYMDFVSIPN